MNLTKFKVMPSMDAARHGPSPMARPNKFFECGDSLPPSTNLGNFQSIASGIKP
jgi:D-tyrosyl-tRNA(Tyr) deacylase